MGYLACIFTGILIGYLLARRYQTHKCNMCEPITRRLHEEIQKGQVAINSPVERSIPGSRQEI